ncbi:MAG: hypothetical protein AAGL98_07630, partial [Planctomycetota bacterium]
MPTRPRNSLPPDSRPIAVVTGTRAEYGLLETVMHAIDAHPRLTLQCVAAGMHLVTATHRDIAFPLAAKVRLQKPAPGSQSRGIAIPRPR